MMIGEVDNAELAVRAIAARLPPKARDPVFADEPRVSVAMVVTVREAAVVGVYYARDDAERAACARREQLAAEAPWPYHADKRHVEVRTTATHGEYTRLTLIHPNPQGDDLVIESLVETVPIKPTAS